MKKIYCLIFILIAGFYSRSSMSNDNVAENDSVALESLAYQLRIDPYFLDKLKNNGSKDLLNVYGRLLKEFENIGDLEGLLVQVGHYCRIHAGHGECNFNSAGKFGDFLYILEDAVGQGDMIVALSQGSPERTRFFRWGSHAPVILLYDSFESKNTVCKMPADIAPLRLVKSLNYEAMQLYLVDEDNAAVEPKRRFQLDMAGSPCVIKRVQ